MKVLLLGPKRQNLIEYLVSCGDSVICTEERVLPESDIIKAIDFIISYGYRHIIKKNIIDLFPGKIINLHISFLPWNKGADPNLWSFLEDTPKGVSIHYVNEGLDTGDILVQKEISYQLEDTLRTSYDRLSRTIEKQLIESWPHVRNDILIAFPQPHEGTIHRLKDREEYVHLLKRGWDTPVKYLIGKAKEK